MQKQRCRITWSGSAPRLTLLALLAGPVTACGPHLQPAPVAIPAPPEAAMRPVSQTFSQNAEQSLNGWHAKLTEPSGS